MSITERLKEHTLNICRCKELLRQLKRIDSEIIEGLALPAVVISDMPKSFTGKITNPTANISAAYQHEKTLILREIISLTNNIESIENALKCLTKKQRYVIERKYFDGLTWTELSIEFCETFPLYTEVNGNVIVQHSTYIDKKTLMSKADFAKLRLKNILKRSGAK
jgi:hypothetical protein